jgi:hypothetical protein
MITVNSISGGKTSAYMAVHYPADYNVFCLVRTDDVDCKFKDDKARQFVEDRIKKPFIGTLEDDLIVYTIMDLEQFLGKEITWLSGLSYDQVITGPERKGGWLPNKLHRFCTTWLKIDPQVQWWHENFAPDPVEMRIGFRANEISRAERMNDRLNKNGLLDYKASFSRHPNGRQKWEIVEWQKPYMPLVEDNIVKDTIVKYWEDKPVKFALYNNCVGCFHRNPLFLNKMYQLHPNKIEWFAKQERTRNGKGTWRSDTTYDRIMKHRPQTELMFEDFGSCDTGGCTD